MGTTVWRWDQAEPFGASPANDDPDGNSVAFDLPLRLPGQRYDAETALHYNYFRDYDPSLGRYGESDPFGLDGGVNTYAYVSGDPLTGIDTQGLFRLPPGVGNLVRPIENPVSAPRQLPNPPQTQPVDPIGPAPLPASEPIGKARYYCKIRCDGVEISDYWASASASASTSTTDWLICARNTGNCPPHIHGEGFGKSPAEAWNNAWDSANNATPRGCYKRHCRGVAGACKNWKGGKR